MHRPVTGQAAAGILSLLQEEALDQFALIDRTERQAPMIDPFGRTISYLRVSVTDRCDFRCTYCMSEHMTFLPKKDLLTLEELDRALHSIH